MAQILNLKKTNLNEFVAFAKHLPFADLYRSISVFDLSCSATELLLATEFVLVFV